MKGTPTGSLFRGALSCRFFILGFPQNKNAALWVLWIYAK